MSHPIAEKSSARSRHRRGCVATEVAICVPPLILLALAAADFGRVAYFHQAVCNAARVGAEQGAMQTVTTYSYADWEQRVIQAAFEEMRHLPEFDPANCDCHVESMTDSDGMTRTKVTVGYPFRTAVSWPLIPHLVPLEKTVEFRQFR